MSSIVEINGKTYTGAEVIEKLKNIPKDVLERRPDMINWDEIFDGKPEGATSMDGHYYVDENGERQWIDY
mgnify:CR=1 FL=1|tara:strand:- start:3356 stop:3565 length:210 start_codon:yes stop_codon:yes gene_type:complete